MKSNSFKEGRRISKQYDVEGRKQIAENFRKKLNNEAQEKTELLNIEGASLERNIKDLETPLRTEGALPEIAHKRSLYRGIVLMPSCFAGVSAETYLIRWTLLAFGLDIAGLLISLALVLLTIGICDQYLTYQRRNSPELYEKQMLYNSIICVFLFLTSLGLLAFIRVDLFLNYVIAQNGSLEAQAVSADNFYMSTRYYIKWLMLLLALSIPVGCASLLNEGVERIIISGSTLRDYRRIRKLRKQQQSILNQIAMWKVWLEHELYEFEAGLRSGLVPQSKKINLESFISLPIIILLVFLTILILQGIAKG
jgi:hypothetical protein